MTDEDKMRLELQQMQRKADETTDESLESTRRMLQLAEETQDTGIKTLVTLDEQGEKLNRIEENLDTINADMREAEKNLRGLEKFCGICTCCWKKQKDFEKSDQYKKGYDGKSAGKSRSNESAGPSASGSGGSAPKSGYINRITNDDREDEMDDNLGQVAGIVDNLKLMAMDMGEELDSQNKQLGRLEDKTVNNADRIEQANKRANDIIRR